MTNNAGRKAVTTGLTPEEFRRLELLRATVPGGCSIAQAMRMLIVEGLDRRETQATEASHGAG